MKSKKTFSEKFEQRCKKEKDDAIKLLNALNIEYSDTKLGMGAADISISFPNIINILKKYEQLITTMNDEEYY